jgi:hypothetical protein
VRGAPPANELVVLDGKVAAHSGGLNLVAAVTSPSQYYYLGSEVVAAKTNEIPAGPRVVRAARADRLARQPRRAPHTDRDRPRHCYGARRRLFADHQSQPTRPPSGGANPRARTGLPFFDHLKDPSALRWTDLEKGQPVTRTLVVDHVVRDLDAESAGLPIVAEGALTARTHRRGARERRADHQSPAHRPQPRRVARSEHPALGIETGLHARLDASRHDDRCRLRGGFSLWANSLFIHSREQNPTAITSPPPNTKAASPQTTPDAPSALSSPNAFLRE